MPNCCMCDKPGEVGTPYIQGLSFVVCRQHFNLFVKTQEKIGLWAWCKRVTDPSLTVINGKRLIGKTVFCNWIDSHYTGGY